MQHIILHINEFLPPANEVCEGYIFTPVSQSFCSQEGYLSRYTPRQVHPPWAGTPPLGRYTPWAGTPPRQVHPPPDTPWAGTSPQAGTPPGRYTTRQVHPPGRYLLGRHTPRMQVNTPQAGTHTPGRSLPQSGAVHAGFHLKSHHIHKLLFISILTQREIQWYRTINGLLYT